MIEGVLPAPSMAFIRRPDNLGFAGGHNYLMQRAFSDGADWVTLVNPDIEIEPGALGRLWAVAEGWPRTLALHGVVLAAPTESERRVAGARLATLVDTSGIVWNRWGRHFDRDQGCPLFPVLKLGDRRAQGISGALMMLSVETHAMLLETSGYVFVPEFLAYREDAELGVRVSALGGECVVHAVGGFSHDRGARNGERTDELQRFLGVRNRLFMRSLLGRRRPGNRLVASVRDALVVVAALCWERSSWSAVVEAWRLRRTMRYRRELLSQRISRLLNVDS